MAQQAPAITLCSCNAGWLKEAEMETMKGGGNVPGLDVGAVGLLFGRLLCLSGLLVAGMGVVAEDISLEALGIFLGVAGYALGARLLGAATVVSSTILLLVVLLISMGELGPMA
jgi:hypothetical protein